MRYLLAARRLAGVLACVGLSCAASARTWTDEDGTTVEAEFVRVEETLLVLRDEERNLIRAPMSRLSEADLDWIEKYKEFIAMRYWGASETRGRLRLLRDDHLVVRLARNTEEVPYGDLKLEDFQHAEAFYEHIEKELPEGFVAAHNAAKPPVPPEGAVERSWTDVRGREIAAYYVGTAPSDAGPTAQLWMEGKEFNVPLSRLSEADRQWIAQRNLASVSDVASSLGALFAAIGENAGDAPVPAYQPRMPAVPERYAGAGRGQPVIEDEFSFDQGRGAARGGLPEDQTAVVEADAPPADDRGPPPWIGNYTELTGNQFDERLDAAFGDYPVINYDDPWGYVYCSHCEGEYVVPVGYGAGMPCPLCGVTLAQADVDQVDSDEYSSGGRPWYRSRSLRKLVISAVVLMFSLIVVGVKYFIGGGEESGEDDEEEDDDE